jgi:hypothetical protein
MDIFMVTRDLKENDHTTDFGDHERVKTTAKIQNDLLGVWPHRPADRHPDAT